MDERYRRSYSDMDEFSSDEGNQVLGLIDQLLHYLEFEAKEVAFNNNLVKVDRQHVGTLLNMIRDNLPQELRQARHIIRHNRELLQEAERIADDIVNEAEVKMAQMVDESEITLKAQMRANELMNEAEDFSQDMHARTMSYIRSHLNELEDVLTQVLVEIQRNKKQLR
ncbi:MAG: hypothetical protein Q4P72_05330 [Eubacteriales bacterium]|nr:hypothetical protein [Eubacteriales bacterium]